VTWQIVPAVLDELLSDENEAKRERVMAALLKMKKLDIEKLIAA
jgi:predicted 3-demethylubiquinone-9 3-methyltransferase (glyoxalase superfamily)